MFNLSPINRGLNAVKEKKVILDFCFANIKNINFVYSTYAEYEQEKVLLQDRHSNANTIAGTQKLHYFRPVSFNVVLVKRFSNSGQSSTKKVSNVQWKVNKKSFH